MTAVKYTAVHTRSGKNMVVFGTEVEYLGDEVIISDEENGIKATFNWANVEAIVEGGEMDPEALAIEKYLKAIEPQVVDAEELKAQLSIPGGYL